MGSSHRSSLGAMGPAEERSRITYSAAINASVRAVSDSSHCSSFGAMGQAAVRGDMSWL